MRGREEGGRECSEIAVSDTSNTSQIIAEGTASFIYEHLMGKLQGMKRPWKCGYIPWCRCTRENRCWSDFSSGNERSSNFVSFIAVIANIPGSLEFLYH